MANDWTYTQNFNDLTDGNINGQDSWVSTLTTAFVVQTSVKSEGAKALAVVSGGGYSASRAITSITTQGTLHISMRSTVNNDNAPFIRLRSTDGSSMCQVITLDGYWCYNYSGSSNVQISAYSANTWYDVVIDFDFPTYKYRVSVDNGVNFTDWQTFITASKTDIASFFVAQADGSGTTTSYYDDIRPWTEIVGPAKLKTRNGLTLAQIKSINGLEIAKVKTLNGLS